MNNPFTHIRPDTCSNCKKERAIECYDYFNKPFNYSLLVDKFLKGDNIESIINNGRNLCYFKCRECGTYYRINWSNFKLPRPLKTEIFLNYLIYKK